MDVLYTCMTCYNAKEDAALALAAAVVRYAGQAEPIRTGCEEINKLANDYLQLAGETPKGETTE